MTIRPAPARRSSVIAGWASAALESLVSKAARVMAAAVAVPALLSGLAGCGTLDLRGHTQSAAMPDNQRLYGPRTEDPYDQPRRALRREPDYGEGRSASIGRSAPGPRQISERRQPSVRYYGGAEAAGVDRGSGYPRSSDDRGVDAIDRGLPGAQDRDRPIEAQRQRQASVAPVHSRPGSELAQGPQYVRTGWARWMGIPGSGTKPLPERFSIPVV